MHDLISLEDYDAAVSLVYDAAMSPSLWDEVLTLIVDRFGQDRWDNAMLLWERVGPPAGRFLGACGVHLEAQLGYALQYAGANDWSVRGHRMPVGSVFHSDELIDRAEFMASPFYVDYLSHYGMTVGLIALIDRHRTDHLCMCFPGPDIGAPELLAAASRRLMPHLQRAVRISRRLSEAELSKASALGALSAAPSAILMCDADLSLSYANPAGEALVRNGYVRLTGDRLSLPDARDTERLRALPGDGSVRCLTFTLAHEDHPPIAAIALRLAGGEGRALHPDFGRAQMLLVAGQGHHTNFANVDRLREWFGFTAAEARLAAALADGAKLEDFAQTRGVSGNAVRFLLKGVFAKAGVNRQSLLVARLRETPIYWRDASATPDLDNPLP